MHENKIHVYWKLQRRITLSIVRFADVDSMPIALLISSEGCGLSVRISMQFHQKLVSAVQLEQDILRKKITLQLIAL